MTGKTRGDVTDMRSDDRWKAGYRHVLYAIPLAIAALEIGTVAWALSIDNRQLLKDGLDWSYDVALYGVAALVFGRSAAAERATAGFVAAVMFVAGAHTVWDLSDKIANPRPIEPFVLGFSAASAIIVALLILAGLWRYRPIQHPIVQATWLSSRNDAISTTFYSALNLAARTLPEIRWPEYSLDVFSAGLAFQASYAITMTILRERRTQRVGAGGDHAMKSES